MSSINIQVTVTGRIGGKSFSWSRIAVIEGILDVMEQAAESLNPGSGFSTTENNAELMDGWHSFSGLAVGIFVNSGPSTVLRVSPNATGKAAVAPALLPANVPYIVYNGAGTGFDGGAGSSNTAGDIPTDDIESVGLTDFLGRASVGSLVGLKLIS